MIFSSVHNCIGVVFVGMSVIFIAKEIATSKDDWAVQITNQQHLKDLQVHGYYERVKRWYLLNKVVVRLVAVALGLILLCVGGGSAVREYTLLEAFDMMVSTISCCGYRGLPDEGEPPFMYILLAAYTNLAVPVFAIALGKYIKVVVCYHKLV